MKKRYSLDKIHGLNLNIELPSIVFLKGDLGSGKTTISQHIIKDIFGILEDVTSPTYTYYNKYILPDSSGYIHHFDLYRLENYDEFVAIGGEEILDNNEGLILIEWPDLLESQYKPDMTVEIVSTENDNEREVNIIKAGE